MPLAGVAVALAYRCLLVLRKKPHGGSELCTHLHVSWGASATPTAWRASATGCRRAASDWGSPKVLSPYWRPAVGHPTLTCQFRAGAPSRQVSVPSCRHTALSGQENATLAPGRSANTCIPEQRPDFCALRTALLRNRLPPDAARGIPASVAGYRVSLAASALHRLPSYPRCRTH